jgi:large-conductance mechanosensitive channel
MTMIECQQTANLGKVAGALFLFIVVAFAVATISQQDQEIESLRLRAQNYRLLLEAKEQRESELLDQIDELAEAGY